MPRGALGDVQWKATFGGTGRQAEWALRERPGAKHPPVGTRATATIVPFGDGTVRWAVIFHAYVPRKPLEMRLKRNETLGRDVEIPPPPSIEKREITGRVNVTDGDVQAAMREAKKLCEETVASGRPNQ